MAEQQVVLFRVLGPIDAVIDGAPIDLGGPRQRRLVAALCADAGSALSTSVLAERVFGDGELPVDPRATIRTYVARLRRVVGDHDVVTTSAAGYRLANAAGIDARIASSMIEEASVAGLDATARVEILDRALSLWRGDPYDGGEAGDWLRAELSRIEEIRNTAVERRFEAMLEAGLHGDAIPELQEAVERDRLRERVVGQLMLALHRSGRRVEATRVFQSHRKNMADELGLEPDPALAKLDRQILGGDPSLDLTLNTGRVIGGYRIGPQIGEGAWSTVHRGVQPNVGREVAIKIIRAELANHPSFIRRFESEAKTLAGLEHPHVVPLYDYWREPGRAFLVFRHLRGPSLEDQLAGSHWFSADEWRRLAHHVGSALDAAHRAGVIHHDVRAANILTDLDGNYFLADFGLAHKALVGSGVQAERVNDWLGGRDADSEIAGGRREDLRAFSSLLAAALPRIAGGDADRLRSVSNHLEMVATGRDLPSAQRLLVEIDSILEGEESVERSTRALPVPALHNPYKGLRAFEESDAGNFFGRERLVAQLVETLETADGAVAVIGPSGIGKSSVLRAGLIPALRRSAIPGSNNWFVATMTPGTDPFDELAIALLRVAHQAPGNIASLLSEPGGLSRVVRSLLPAEESATELLLVIDQFEELFTIVEDETVRVSFLEALETACRDERCRLRVVLSIRADFWDRPLRYGSFARLFEDSVVHVAALEPDQLERAITGPAGRIGCEFEPGLVGRIVADVHRQPGALPHMQFALTEMMEHHRSLLLTLESYDRIGGVAGAVGSAAEGCYQRADEGTQKSIRRLFGRLVIVKPGSSATRDRVDVESLQDLDDVRTILDAYGHARLLTFDRDKSTREPTVEIAHEALIGAWPQLARWLEEDGENLVALRNLRAACTEWQDRGRDSSELYRGGKLAAAEELLGNRELPPLESEFLAASQAERERDRAARRHAVRRLQGLLAGVACLAALAMIAGVIAFQNASNARDSRAAAETRRLSSDASVIGLENPDTALLLAAEAHRRDPSASTLLGLQRAMSSTGAYLGQLGWGTQYIYVAWIDDQIVGVADEWIDVFDVDSQERVDRIELPAPLGATLLEWEKAPKPFDVEGNTFAVTLSDGEILVLDIATGERTLVQTISTVNGIALSPDANQLAVGSVDRTVRVFDLKSGSQIWETVTYAATNLEEIPFPPGIVWFPELQPSFLPAFTAGVLSAGTTDVEWVSGPSDGSLVVAIGGSEVHSFDARSGDRINRAVPLLDLNGRTVAGGARYVDLLHDGTILVRAWGLLYRFDHELDQIGMQDDFAMGRADQSGVAAANIVSTLDEPMMALATDGLIKFGTANEPAEGRSGIFTGASGPSYMAVGPDGGVAAIASSEGIRLVALDARSLVTSSAPRRGAGLVSQTYDASEAYVYSLFGGVSRAIDLTGSRPRDTELPNIPPNAPIQGAPVPADVDMIYLDSAVSFINLDTGEDLGITSLQWFGDSFSNDGTRFFSPQDPDLVEGEPTFYVFDLRNGETVGSGVLTDFVGPESSSDRVLYASAWSADDSQLILTFTDGLAVRFDTDEWDVIDTWEPDPTDSLGILEVAYSPDGRFLATRDSNASLDIRDPDSLEILFSIETGGGAVEELGYGPIWSKDSRYLLTIKDGNPRLWNVEERALAGAFPNDPGFLARGFASPGYPQLVTVRDDHLQFWNTDPSSWFDIACRAAGRNLTRTEWEQLGPTDAEYAPTCPQWP